MTLSQNFPIVKINYKIWFIYSIRVPGFFIQKIHKNKIKKYIEFKLNNEQDELLQHYELLVERFPHPNHPLSDLIFQVHLKLFQ